MGMAEKECIEREAAYPLAKKICDAIDSEDFQRLNFGMRILDWIDDIPAADVRPVARGQWVDGKCNQCGEHAPFWSMATTYYRSRYCPNCGAEMEES